MADPVYVIHALDRISIMSLDGRLLEVIPLPARKPVLGRSEWFVVGVCIGVIASFAAFCLGVRP